MRRPETRIRPQRGPDADASRLDVPIQYPAASPSRRESLAAT